MSEHPNAALHRTAHDAFSRGDMDTLSKMIAEDTVWHICGNSPASGDFNGREAVFGEFLANLGELSSGAAKFVGSQDHLGDGEYSVSFFRFGATRNGRTADFGVCEVIRWGNGRIAEEWFYLEDQYGWDEFWS